MKFKRTIAFMSIISLCFGSTLSVFADTETAVKANSEITAEAGVTVTTYEELSSAITSGEKTIYIANSIDVADQIQLSLSNQSLIGVPDKDGSLPILNFKNMKGENDITNSKSSDKDVALRISSENNTVENLIIEKSHDNGILIKGTNAKYNKIKNCILRYNNDSGIQVTGGACGNTLTNIYSYRNCDVFTLGGNADGFAIKLGAGPAKTTDLGEMLQNRNYFKNCYSWENSDDAWDSFDKELKDQSEDFQKEGGHWTYRNDYENCMCWNNGTPQNSFGYNDYMNNLPLDENLPMIMRFKDLSTEETYANFVKAYNDGTLCEKSEDAAVYFGKLDEIFGTIPTSKGDLTPSQIAFENWGGNPNGFKLGSKFTLSNSLRFMKNCITFDHVKYGFDKNNSAGKIFLENCIAFNNLRNYHLEGCTAYKWKNVSGKDEHEENDLASARTETTDVKVDTLSEEKETIIRNASKEIISAVSENKIPETDVFSKVF